MPKILFVLGGPLEVGGAERQLLQLCGGLIARGFDVVVLCLAGRGSLAADFERMGARVETTALTCGTSGLRKLRRFAAGWWAVTSLMRRWRPDVVHFFLPRAYAVGGLAALPFRRSLRVMSRRGMNRYLDGRPIARLNERFLHGRMQVLLANSLRVANELIGEGSPASRVGLIYNGVDLQAFSNLPDSRVARARLGLAAKPLILVKVANLWEYKGHADLLRALAGADLGNEWLLLLVGRDEGSAAGLMDLTRALSLDGRVQFLGVSKEVPVILAAADIGISASHEEGFSNSVIEYLAAGLSVVASDVGGNSEAVGQAGLLYRAGDVSALRGALEILSDRVLRKKLSGVARRQAGQFSLERCVGTYAGLYRSLLDGDGLPPEVGLSSVRSAATATDGADTSEGI